MAFIDGHVEYLTLGDLGYEVLDNDGNQVEHDLGSNALWNGQGFDKKETSSTDP